MQMDSNIWTCRPPSLALEHVLLTACGVVHISIQFEVCMTFHSEVMAWFLSQHYLTLTCGGLKSVSPAIPDTDHLPKKFLELFNPGSGKPWDRLMDTQKLDSVQSITAAFYWKKHTSTHQLLTTVYTVQ